jgi:hypothetical protein
MRDRNVGLFGILVLLGVGGWSFVALAAAASHAPTPPSVHAAPTPPPPGSSPAPAPQPPPTPYVMDIIEDVARLYPHLLETNTWQSTGEFTQRVVLALCAGVAPASCEWGHVGKSAGEGGATLHTGVRVSHDVIWHKPSNQQVDILAYAAANSHPDPVEVPPGPATLTWIEIPRHEYRPSNLWTPAQPFADDQTPPPPPPPNCEVCVNDLAVARLFIARLEQDIEDALTWIAELEQTVRDATIAHDNAVALAADLQARLDAQATPKLVCRSLFGIRYNCRIE